MKIIVVDELSSHRMEMLQKLAELQNQEIEVYTPDELPDYLTGKQPAMVILDDIEACMDLAPKPHCVVHPTKQYNIQGRPYSRYQMAALLGQALHEMAARGQLDAIDAKGQVIEIKTWDEPPVPRVCYAGKPRNVPQTKGDRKRNRRYRWS